MLPPHYHPRANNYVVAPKGILRLTVVVNMPQLYVKHLGVSHLPPMSLPFQGGYIYTVLTSIETKCNNAVIVKCASLLISQQQYMFEEKVMRLVQEVLLPGRATSSLKSLCI